VEAAHTLQPVILLLLVALIAMILAKPARLSPIVGYLIAGVLIGPHGFQFIQESDTTHLMAELGIVFLLFDIGLHFSLAHIKDARREILGLGPVQVLLCLIGLSLFAILAGVTIDVAIVIGAALALSSTAAAVQAIKALGVQRCPIGVSATAVLIFQDICAIFLLILATSLGSNQADLGIQLATAGVKAVIAFGAALLLGRFVIGPIFKLVVQTQNEESFTALALLVVLATAAATGEMELSLTLGAFLAGMIISETPYRHLIQTEVKPFRGLLLSFFFITVGMALNTEVLLEQWHWVLAVAGGMIILKITLIFLAAQIVKFPFDTSIQLAFILAQGSEFAFIVIATPSVNQALGIEYSAILVAAVAISIAVTPFLAAFGQNFARKKADVAWQDAEVHSEKVQRNPSEGDIIIFGMDKVGRTLADSLEAHNITYKAFEYDHDRFVEARTRGYPVAFGDLSDLRMADTVNISHAKAVVITQGRYQISQEIAPIVKQRYPNLNRYISVNNLEESEKYAALGMITVQSISQPVGMDMVMTILKQQGINSELISQWITRQQYEYFQSTEMPRKSLIKSA